MKVLVIGSGGKEHAIVWKLSQSKRVSQIFCAPGNAGIKKHAQCINIRIDEIASLCEFAKDNKIDLTVVGSEVALSLGIVDHFKNEGLLIFGPTQAAAKIEYNKVFAKKLMHKYKIPTVFSLHFERESQAIDCARKAKYPLVIKYDCLSGGKGVFACDNFEQAKKTIEKCFASLCKGIMIEDYLNHRKFSFHVITDGYNAVPLSPAFSYKKVYDGNSGPYSAGVGAYAPLSSVDNVLEEKIAQTIVFPLLDALNKENLSFLGVLNFTLGVNENDDPYVIGINSTFGDPEAQVILPLLEDDLFDILYSATIDAFSDEYESFKINDFHAMSVSLISGGYPGVYKKGHIIEGLDEIDDDDRLIIFHSATSIDCYGDLVTAGGRVLSVTAVASTLHRAHDIVYETIDMISFKDMKYRKDIAKILVEEKSYFL